MTLQSHSNVIDDVVPNGPQGTTLASPSSRHGPSIEDEDENFDYREYLGQGSFHRQGQCYSGPSKGYVGFTSSLIVVPMALHVAVVQLPLLDLDAKHAWVLLGIPGTLVLICLLLFCHCCDPGIVPRRKKVRRPVLPMSFREPPLSATPL